MRIDTLENAQYIYDNVKTIETFLLKNKKYECVPTNMFIKNDISLVICGYYIETSRLQISPRLRSRITQCLEEELETLKKELEDI